MVMGVYELACFCDGETHQVADLDFSGELGGVNADLPRLERKRTIAGKAALKSLRLSLIHI